MDMTILVAMLVPIALFIILTPILYALKLKRDYNDKLNRTYQSFDEAILAINSILEEGTKEISYVVFSLKDSNYYIQYGYEQNGFILYFFKSPVFETIHYSKFKNVLINHGFSQVEGKPIEQLENKEFLELNGGFNVNVGIKFEEIKTITKEVFEKVFEENDIEVHTELEL